MFFMNTRPKCSPTRKVSKFCKKLKLLIQFSNKIAQNKQSTKCRKFAQSCHPDSSSQGYVIRQEELTLQFTEKK
jgi:hypothetical protein